MLLFSGDASLCRKVMLRLITVGLKRSIGGWNMMSSAIVHGKIHHLRMYTGRHVE